MPHPKVYQNAAERQRAYRARRAAQLDPRTAKAPGYPKWRKSIQEAYELLNDTYEEIHYWMQERSERWQESDRASEMEADRDKLEEIIDDIDNLYIRQKGAS